MSQTPSPTPSVREGVQDTPERTTRVLREAYRRNLKHPGLTVSIVVDEETLQQLEPVEKVRSKTGAHGEDIYIIDRPVLVLRYSKSNSGKVRWSVSEITPTIERKLKYHDLPTPFRNAIESYARYYGLELYPWEEE